MPVNNLAYKSIMKSLQQKKISLVAVSKTKPVADIQALYDLGQRDFGENFVQEAAAKQARLPGDIRWHYIGHLQSNKVKSLAAFVHLVHGVDSLNLLVEINKQAQKKNRIINCLLQVHIAQEETKFGLNEAEVQEILNHAVALKNICVCGLMGMASFTDDMQMIRTEFRYLKSIFDKYFSSSLVNSEAQISNVEQQPILSMGMSSDYAIAIEEGSTMIRIGSLLFGNRE
jgi:pyridoxal phosphate enzyme (YggS family)